MAQKGKSFTVAVNLGTDQAPNYQLVGGQRDFTRTRTATSIDAGDKLSSTRKKLAGDVSESVKCQALYIQDDAAQQNLRNAFLAGTLVQLQFYNFGNAYEKVLASITNMSEQHPDQGVSTIEIDFDFASDPVKLTG